MTSSQRTPARATAVTRTVDLVVTGDSKAALAAAIDAVRCGRRVLLVLRSCGRRVVQRARGFRRQAANTGNGHLTVMTNAEVVCVDGVGGVEAVVIRYARTGRLCAVNTPSFLSCGLVDSTKACASSFQPINLRPTRPSEPPHDPPRDDDPVEDDRRQHERTPS